MLCDPLKTVSHKMRGAGSPDRMFCDTLKTASHKLRDIASQTRVFCHTPRGASQNTPHPAPVGRAVTSGVCRESAT